MAHLHLSTARMSAVPEQAAAEGRAQPDPRKFNDLWISDLSNDLSCFGLCGPESNALEPHDELAMFSLTSDVDSAPGTAARTWHDKLGL